MIFYVSLNTWAILVIILWFWIFQIHTSYTKLRPFNFSFSLQLPITERIRESKEIPPYSNGTSDEKDSKNSKSYQLGRHVTLSILWWMINIIWLLLTMQRVSSTHYIIIILNYPIYDWNCSSERIEEVNINIFFLDLFKALVVNSVYVYGNSA